MAQPTYQDLLDALGLSSWQFLLLLLGALLFWSLGTWLWQLRIVGKVKIDRAQLPTFKAIYISYWGSYDDLGVIYSQSAGDFQTVFKFSNSFAIFYSDPPNERGMSRALIGVYVKPIEEGKVDLFLSKFPQYRRGEFPASDYLLSTLPFS
jgi:hypothetical protein